jgi:hypothetical protein
MPSSTPDSTPSGSGELSDHVAGRIAPEQLAADLDALAAIAGANGGARATGTPGEQATADHVERELRAAGYAPWTDAFRTAVFSDPGGSAVVVGGRGGTTFDDARVVLPLIFSPAGTAEGPVIDLGWDPDSRAADGPGCAASDFADVPPGAIVLARPAPCTRRTVVEHAQAAGAAAVVTAQPWAGPGEVRRSTLITPEGLTIPALAVTRDVGNALAGVAADGGRATVAATGTTADGPVRSVFAEVVGTGGSQVVMVGAHLDSSMDGPGVNDDGSGIAAVLALARAFAGSQPSATVRFAFWAAEETGLHGSGRYVRGLPPRGGDRIAAYLNADMLGSPNGFPMVYDEPSAAPGSDAIRDLFAAALGEAGLAWEGVDLGSGGDHAPFTAAGIVTGGLYTGSAEVVGRGQAERFGREAGAMADACYHLACDGRSNVDEVLLVQLTRVLARVAAGIAEEAGGG